MPSNIPQTVWIIDDDAQVRRYLSEVLGSIGIAVQGFVSGEEFIRHWQPSSRGCVLLDIRMPRVSGPEVQEWLQQQRSDVPVIFLSGYADVSTAVRAMRLGAFDFIEKPFNVQHLIERVYAALRQAEANSLASGGASLPGNGSWQRSLTRRERDVLARIVSGKRSKEIAGELGISERTVETHRSNIMGKAGARTVAELVVLVIGGHKSGPPA